MKTDEIISSAIWQRGYYYFNASKRRFLEFEKRANPDALPKLWDKYCIYVSCWDDPDTFAEWVSR